jgi:hypothetical protein
MFSSQTRQVGEPVRQAIPFQKGEKPVVSLHRQPGARMRRIALIFIPLFLVACNGETTAPNLARLSVPPTVSRSASAGAQVFQDTFEVPVDFLYTPADYPCLKEPIHVSGSFLEHDVLVVSGSELHLTLHQSTNTVTATGVISGDKYAFSGPFTLSGTAPTDGVSVRELTLHNINHVVGPGKDSDIFFRTFYHITLNPTTGEIRTEISKDDVRCS